MTDLIILNKLRVTQAWERNLLLFDTKTDDGNINDLSEDDEVKEGIIAFGIEDSLRRLQETEI